MKQIAIKLVQWTISLLSWLTISPIFYYLTGRWKLMSKKRRIGLVIISPMFLTIYAFMCLAGLSIYYDYHRKYRFADQDVLTRITGVTYPDFKIIEYTRGETSFTGDYVDFLLIEFKEPLPSAFYQYLDSLAVTGNSNWFIDGNIYTYDNIWGNGSGAPNGEDDEEDMFLNIKHEKGRKQATICYGAW